MRPKSSPDKPAARPGSERRNVCIGAELQRQQLCGQVRTCVPGPRCLGGGLRGAGRPAGLATLPGCCWALDTIASVTGGPAAILAGPGCDLSHVSGRPRPCWWRQADGEGAVVRVNWMGSAGSSHGRDDPDAFGRGQRARRCLLPGRV